MMFPDGDGDGADGAPRGPHSGSLAAVNGAGDSGWDSDAARASKRPRSVDTPAKSEDEGGEDDGDFVGYGGPRDDRELYREPLTPEGVEAAVAELRGMWETAAILDFLHLFRAQLKLTRSFSAEELERVMVTSPGDSGLLADLHIDLMRGISPKSDVGPDNWQTHLANKIRFHWRNLADGTPCPFKPEKYYEKVTYAALPAPQRARALHFLCCIRCDREDIQVRLMEAEREKTDEEKAAAEAEAEAARQRAARGTRAAAEDEEDAAGVSFETLDTFRRGPTGLGAGGASFFYFDHADSTGARIYREGPPPADAADADADGDREEEPDEDAEARAAAADAKAGRRRRERALRKMPLPKSVFKLRDPPRSGSWELAAASLGEVEALGQSLVESRPAADKALGRLVLEEIVPALKEKEEAEERKRRAAERVRSRLGVGEGGSGDESGLGYGGRSRRTRAQVNYAFSEYDEQLRYAIRYSQRRGDSPGFEDGWGEGRRRRRAVSPLNLTGEEAVMMGLRRGRSSAVLRGADSVPELNERAIRQAAARVRGGSDSDLPPMGRMGMGTTASGRRSRLAPKYRRDYVADFDDADMIVGEESDKGDEEESEDGDEEESEDGGDYHRGQGRRGGGFGRQEDGRGGASERFMAQQAQQDAEAVAAVAARQNAEQAVRTTQGAQPVQDTQAALLQRQALLMLQEQLQRAGVAPGSLTAADLVRILAERQAALQAAQLGGAAAAVVPPQQQPHLGLGGAAAGVAPPLQQQGQGAGVRPPMGAAPGPDQGGPHPQAFMSQNAPEIAARTAASPVPAPSAPGPGLVNWGGHGPRQHNPTPRVPPPP
jgi:hypothetical protein